MNIFGMEIDRGLLDAGQASYLERYNAVDKPSVSEIWREMDRIWDELGLNNKRPLAGQPVNSFYSHPVWILNGIFTAQDEESRRHRLAIARRIAELDAGKIADYGGGFGELALTIAEVCPSSIDIIEPYPSRIGKARVEKVKLVGFQAALNDNYDLIIAQDVLEHVENPIALAEDIVRSLKSGGHAIFANCFYPMIKCHLPSTFYLRRTFQWVVAPLGLRPVGRIAGAAHAVVFKKGEGAVHSESARSRECIARILGSLVNRAADGVTVLLRDRRVEKS